MKRYQAMIQKQALEGHPLHLEQKLGEECDTTKAAINLIHQWSSGLTAIGRRTWNAWVNVRELDEHGMICESSGLMCDVKLA